MAKSSSTHTTMTGKQVLTIQDAQKQAKEMQGFRKEITKSKTAASSFLHATGMYDKNGKLKKEYK